MKRHILTDELKVLRLSDIDGEEVNKEKIVRTILEMKEDIEETFSNDEYIKMDLTNKEIVGIKSTAKLGEIEIEDLAALNFILAHDEKYRDANLLNLGNVNVLYEEFKE